MAYLFHASDDNPNSLQLLTFVAFVYFDSKPFTERFRIKVDQDVFMQSCLISFIQLKALINDILNNFFEHFFGFIFISKTYRISFLLVE